MLFEVIVDCYNPEDNPIWHSLPRFVAVDLHKGKIKHLNILFISQKEVL